MKAILFLALLGFVRFAHAETLGVPDGNYEGSGVLKSDEWLVPNLKFHSDRILKNGTIEAHTQAFLLGHVVAEASAKLKFVGSAADFNVVDLESGDVVGEGLCDEVKCSFSATVMDGDLTLSESWVVSQDGFSVENAHQTFKGKSASYSGDFQRAD